MSDMNETARAVLRQAVLEARVKLREARTNRETAQNVFEGWNTEFNRWRNHIESLQIAAGEPIEIDPAYPEIK